MEDNNESLKQETEGDVSPQIIVNHGRTSYVVTLHFLGRGKETIEDKIRRLILKDIKKGDF